MTHIQLQLPVLQNWGCHNCGGCCREHLIEISEDEKRRIEQQGWTAADGISMARPVIQSISAGRYRLAHQDDGACVFLDGQGLCRIHSRFGEPAKPLACRVYPYAFHPSGRQQLTTSLRFSCPSVVQNLGPPLEQQRNDLQQLAEAVVGGKQKDYEPPPIHYAAPHGLQQVNWTDFHRFLKALDSAIADDRVHFVVRLVRILTWLELVEQSQFQTIRGPKLDDFLTMLIRASEKAQPDNDLPLHRPDRMGRIMFRLMTAQCARHDTEAMARSGIGTRVGLLTAALKFTFGLGAIPVLAESASVAKAFPQSVALDARAAAAVKFTDVEGEFDGRQPDFDELFTRYFRVKIQAIHFCGPAHYHTSLLDGFRSLALMYPMALWLARVRALRLQRQRLELADVQAALATLDHNFGYSPALGTRSALNRVNILSRLKQITRLISWYSM